MRADPETTPETERAKVLEPFTFPGAILQRIELIVVRIATAGGAKLLRRSARDRALLRRELSAEPRSTAVSRREAARESEHHPASARHTDSAPAFRQADSSCSTSSARRSMVSCRNGIGGRHQATSKEIDGMFRRLGAEAQGLRKVTSGRDAARGNECPGRPSGTPRD